MKNTPAAGNSFPVSLEFKSPLPPATTPLSDRKGFNRLGFVDALRGLAILMVVAVHVGLFSNPDSLFHFLTRYGQLGVQLFFVVSAFTLSYASERVRPNWRERGAFLVRRWFRIAPMYYVAIVGFFVFAVIWKTALPWPAPFLQPEDYDVADVSLNFLFLHALSPSANNTIVPGGWSIATEFSFYFLFAACLIGAGPKKLTLMIAAYGALVVFALLLAGPQILAHARVNEFLYFSLPVQLPCFFLGMLAYGIYRSGNPHRTWSWLAVVVPWPLIFWLWDSRLPWAFLVIPTLAALSFAGMTLLASQSRNPPKWLMAIGLRSYSIYLCHLVLVVTLVQPIARSLAFVGTSLSELIAYVLVVVLSFVIAGVTYRWVELPGMAVGKSLSRRLSSGELLRLRFRVVEQRNPSNNDIPPA